jgi:cytoskeletal protein RodZ
MEMVSLAELGAYLVAERDKEGLSRSDISSRTKITMDQLANMEQGAFTGLAPVYAKGFLRSYALAAGLDPADIVGAYKKITGQTEVGMRKPLTTKYKEIDLGGDDGVSLTGALLAVIAILIALTLLAVFNSRFHNFVSKFLPFMESLEAPSPASPPASSSARPSPQPGGQAAPARPVGQSSQASPQAADAPKAAASAQESQASQLPEARAPAAPLPAELGGRLTLRAKKPTWAQVTVDNGPLIHLIFKEGEASTLDSLRGISVITGDGSSLEASWNGEALGPIGPASPVEAHFPRQRL